MIAKIKFKENNDVESINFIYKLPNIYNGIENVINGYEQRTDLHNLDGFFEVEEPNLLENEKKGIPFLENNIVKFPIEQIPPKTQAELDIEAQTVLDNDSSAQIIQNHRQNGQTQLRRIWDKIQRLKDKGQLTPNQFRTVSEVLFDALIPLEFGMWQVAQTKVNATPTSSGIIGTIRTQVKAIIDDYVTANY